MEALAVLEEVGARPEIARCLAGLGRVALDLGAVEQARRHLTRSLKLSQATGTRIGVARGLEALAALAVRENQAERAVQLAAAATALRESAGVLPLPPARIETYLASARHLGEPTVARIWAQGLTLSSEAAVALAIDTRPPKPADGGTRALKVVGEPEDTGPDRGRTGRGDTPPAVALACSQPSLAKRRSGLLGGAMITGVKEPVMTVYGAAWCPHCKRVKKFLAAHRVRYANIDIDAQPEAIERLKELQDGGQIIPTVVYPDGTHEVNPSDEALASRIGLTLEADRSAYDLVIVGGGPAGLAAAIYAAREGIDAIVVSASALGGQAGISDRIDNYPGFPDGISGGELADRFVAQARRYGVELVLGGVGHRRGARSPAAPARHGRAGADAAAVRGPGWLSASPEHGLRFTLGMFARSELK